MTKMIFAAVCSTLLTASTLQAAAAPRQTHKAVRAAPQTTEQLRNARAAIVTPDVYYSGMARGNAGAAPAGQ